MSTIANVSLLTGPLLLGHLLNWLLYGVLIVQVYLYYIAFPRDGHSRQSLVGFTLLFETLQLVLSTYDAFRVFGKGWGNPEQLDRIGLEGLSIPVFASVASCICQLFYASRLYAISNNRWMSSSVALLAVIQVVFGIYDGVKCFIVGRLSGIPGTNVVWINSAWAGTSALCHVIITFSTFWYLLRLKSSSKMKRTSTLITRLIKLTVETGFICAAVNMLALLLFLVRQDTLFYIVPLATTSKLYTNCLLAVLNSRFKILGGRYTQELEVEDRISSFNFASSVIGLSDRHQRQCNIEHSTFHPQTEIVVEISRMTEIQFDSESPISEQTTACKGDHEEEDISYHQ
ncbi:hypothetical protein EIP91_005815 [Steccherinum ochraceum]|uniref:DUF6534 domain-containing protein n=1 Tax=Steccherinum ochraceum TaxID=92696 RepID=A0A4R0R6N1_9APHY|nr:hypothetical protein EIP91_005815 [Steccherinum ochraceum]